MKLQGFARVTEGQTVIAKKVRYVLSWDVDGIPVLTYGAQAGSIPGVKSNFTRVIATYTRRRDRKLKERFESRTMLTLEMEDGWKWDFTLESYNEFVQMYVISPDVTKDLYR